MNPIGLAHRARRGLLVLAVAGVTLVSAGTALAQRHGPEQRNSPPQRWHGDIRQFHQNDWPLWRGGHWVHGPHDGRVGWWWVVGTGVAAYWYFYPAPVYPYPNPWEPPPVTIVSPPPGAVVPPPPTQYWYYCQAAQSYYPYVATCPGGWVQVPATPSGEAPVPAR